MRFFLTTAIDYVNSRPHLGTAYEKITADVIARYKRLCGFETRFLMGNDEHSQNVYKRAREAGEDPLAYCDRMEQVFREVWSRLSISFDDFIRTTEPRHRAGVQRLVERCREAGDIYEGHYEGWYCVSCEAFKQEKDLVDGLCPIHLTKPDWIREKNHFFRLSKYRQPLLDHYAAHPGFIQPDVRRNEILRLVESGLEDISVSRAGQAWGIPLPFDADSVVYVWFDALINYASAVGYGNDEALFERWWPADLHIVGKDITRFHCVIWPAMLMSAGVALPRQVFGHGWVHLKGVRMSKSLGTVVDPLDAADRLGADPLRLYLVKEIPYGGDGDFSWERFEERYNVDLANNLGNLVSRVTTMAEKYRRSSIAPTPLGPGRLARVASDVLQAYRTAMDAFALDDGAFAAFRLIDATNEFIAESEPWALARDTAQADRLSQVLYDASEALRVAAVLLLPVMPTACAEILRRAGEPGAPGDLRLERDAVWKADAARTLVKGPNLWPRLDPSAPRDAQAADEREREEDGARKGGTREDGTGKDGIGKDGIGKDRTQVLSHGSNTPTTESRVTDTPDWKPSAPAPEAAPTPEAAIAAATSAPAPPPAPQPAPSPAAADRISIDEFMKVQLKVARVLTAERVPKSKKLVKLWIDLGSEQRTIVAGIAGAYEPETLVGRTIVIVANLEPARLMGIESNGMVLAASTDEGRPMLLSVDGEATPGMRVK